MVCKTDITTVFIELDIKHKDGCMGSRGHETRRPTGQIRLRSGKTRWRDE